MGNLMTALVKSVDVTKTKVASGGAVLVAYSSGPTDAALPPLVFLHAAVSDSRLWAAQFDAFATTRRVVAWDRRGFGATAAVDEDYSSVADLWAVLDALAIDRAVLVGCSQGGLVALDATIARPDRVAALVLVAAAIGGAPVPPEHDPRLDGLIAAHADAKESGDIDEQNRIKAHVWLDGPFEAEGRVAGEARERFLAMNRIALEAPAVGSDDAPSTAYAALADLGRPAFVMWGPLDVPSVIVNMRHAAATIPGARHCELEGVAHLPNLEAPERFNAALAGFLHDSELR